LGGVGGDKKTIRLWAPGSVGILKAFRFVGAW
jgi:hypothetical protein